jgi:oligopeptide/dipeptide ABC transporter ATP-binding protein
MKQNEILLSVQKLYVSFSTEDGDIKAVQDVSFSIRKGQTFALVGESGCGKTTIALSIMRLLQAGQGKIISGEIIFENQDLLKLSKKQMRRIRGNKITLVSQEPMTSLNPVHKVGNQIAEVIRLHQNKNAKQAWADAVEMLHKVGIAEPEQIACVYPHQLSGGMQQRVMIAMAVCCKPALLIADEPTTALDATIQVQILSLLDRLQKEIGMSILLVTHDLGVVSEYADVVAVMYASRIVEKAPKRQLFAEPFHPYTRGLLQSLPRLGVSVKRLQAIPGAVPNPLHFPTGCKFHPRCPIGRKDRRCRTVEPELREVQLGRCVACWYASSYETDKEHYLSVRGDL